MSSILTRDNITWHPSILGRVWKKHPRQLPDFSTTYLREAVNTSIEVRLRRSSFRRKKELFKINLADSSLRQSGGVNKIIDIQKLGSEDKAHVFAMLDAFLQSHKAKKVFAS